MSENTNQEERVVYPDTPTTSPSQSLLQRDPRLMKNEGRNKETDPITPDSVKGEDLGYTKDLTLNQGTVLGYTSTAPLSEEQPQEELK